MVGFLLFLVLLDLQKSASGRASGSSILQHTFNTLSMCTGTVPSTGGAYKIVTTRFMMGCYRACSLDKLCYGAMFIQPEFCYLYSETNPACMVSPVYPGQKFRYKTGIVSQSTTPVYIETSTTTNAIPTCINGGTYNAISSKCDCIGGYVGTSCERLMIDCTEGYQLGHYIGAGYGVYQIKPANSPTAFSVQCNMNDGGGTMFMKNTEWNSDIKRDNNWTDYKVGFGFVLENHWLGLDYIHYVSTNRPQSAFMEVFSVIDYKGRWRKYDNFRVDNEASGYRMTYSRSDPWTQTDADADLYWIKPIEPTPLGDSMVGLNGTQFSTKDTDNDQGTFNCAADLKGGWWYNQNCAECNPNGDEPNMIFWHNDYGTDHIPFIEMMLRAM